MSAEHFNPHRPRVVITSTGIHIGGAYVPPPAPMGSEAEKIQEVLLAKPAPLAERLLDALDRHWAVLMVAGTVAGVAIGMARRALG